MATTLAPEALSRQKGKRPRYPLGYSLKYLVVVAARSSLCPSSSSLPQPWLGVSGNCPQVPLWPLQEAASPHPGRLPFTAVWSSAGSCAQVRGCTGQRGLLGDVQTMGTRGPASRLLPAHYGADPQGPRQTYRDLQLARNSSSAQKLLACSPTAQGARPASRPALPPLPPAVAARSYGAAAAGTLRRRIPARR